MELFAAHPKPIGTAMWGYGPRAVQVVAGKTTKIPVMEGIGPARAWINTVPDTHPMLGIYWSRDDNITQFERDEAEREALIRQTRLVVYCDRHGFNGIDDLKRLTKDGHEAWAFQMGYSGAVAAEGIEAVKLSIEQIEKSHDFLLLGRADETTEWHPLELDLMLPALVDLFNAHPRCKGIGMLPRGPELDNSNWPARRMDWYMDLIADNPPLSTDNGPVSGDTPPTGGQPGTGQPPPGQPAGGGDVDKGVAAAIAAVIGLSALAKTKVGKKIGGFFKRLKWWG